MQQVGKMAFKKTKKSEQNPDFSLLHQRGIIHYYLLVHEAISSCEYYLFLNQNATLTNKIKAGTSTKGPITPAKARPLLIPNILMAS